MDESRNDGEASGARASGHLLGDVKAKYLTVAAGARTRGEVEFGWDGTETKRNESKAPSAKSGTDPVA